MFHNFITICDFNKTHIVIYVSVPLRDPSDTSASSGKAKSTF